MTNLSPDTARLDVWLGGAVAQGLWLLGATPSATALEIAELPLPQPAPGGAAALRAVGPLYLAAELERAGLLPAAEELASSWASGAVAVDVSSAAELLKGFWRERGERFSSSERQALFARVFGASDGPVLAGPAAANEDFLLRMLDLAEAVAHAGDVGMPAPQLDGELSLRARLLTDNLSRHGSSIVLYAAGEILGAVRAAIAILRALGAARLWGSHDLWSLLAAINQRRGRHTPDALAHARRGQAGMAVLAWLADVSEGSRPLLPLQAPVVAAAVAWIQASLAIEDEARRPLESVA